MSGESDIGRREKRSWRAALDDYVRIERTIVMIALGAELLLLLITGMVLLSYYRPPGEYEYHDMRYLQFDVPVGMIMRLTHRQAAAHVSWIALLHGLWVIAVFVLEKKPRQTPRGALAAACFAIAALAGLVFFPWESFRAWTSPAPDVSGWGRYDGHSFLNAGAIIGRVQVLSFLVIHAFLVPIAGAIGLTLLWPRPPTAVPPR